MIVSLIVDQVNALKLIRVSSYQTNESVFYYSLNWNKSVKCS